MKKTILWVSLALFSCQKQEFDIDALKKKYRRVTIQENTHTSSPLFTKVFYKNCDFTGSAYFTDKSRYYLTNNVLQWNKLSGFKLDANSVPNHAGMVAWRYIVNDSIWEVAPYFNKNGIIFPDTNEILRVGMNEVFNFRCKLQGKNATITIFKDSTMITKGVELINALFFTRVSVWFGGTEKAPNFIELYKRIN
jgi:hypothetical protein